MVKTKAYVPVRGDIVWINFNPQSGHEQKGRRPALVLSPEDYNKKVGLAIFCPVTNQVKGYPFEVLIPEKMKVLGVILADQVKSLDWKTRNTELICQIPEEVTKIVLERIYTLLT